MSDRFPFRAISMGLADIRSNPRMSVIIQVSSFACSPMENLRCQSSGILTGPLRWTWPLPWTVTASILIIWLSFVRMGTVTTSPSRLAVPVIVFMVPVHGFPCSFSSSAFIWKIVQLLLPSSYMAVMRRGPCSVITVR